MLMTPALGFFYGGLVRQKNVVSTIMQCVIIFALSTGVWTLWGYSLAFAPTQGGFIGGLKYAFLHGVGAAPNEAYAATIPGSLFYFFQLKFAAITPALIIGAFAERIRFRSLIVFVILWTTVRLCAGGALGLGCRRLAEESGRSGFCRRNGRACAGRSFRARFGHGHRPAQ